MFKSGFVAILGRPNAGKSTLMNTIIGQKVAVITKKAGTTRNQIKGIWNTDSSQSVFLDTPGISQDKRTDLDKIFERTAYRTTEDVDLIIYIISGIANKEIVDWRDKEIIENLKNNSAKKIILVSKNKLIDQKKKETILSEIKDLELSYDELIFYDAYESKDIDKVKNMIIDYLPEGEAYYLDDSVTDISDEFFIQEIIREQALKFLNKEVPHALRIEIDDIKISSKSMTIRSTVGVERESQKGIVIGKGAEMIKKIGTYSRKELEQTYNKKIILDLNVKVRKNWRNKSLYTKEFKI